MSQPPVRRPGDRVVRRRFKASKTIDLPPASERQGVPNPRRHAKLFSLGLVAVVFVAAGLLSLPWASRSGESTNFIDALFTAVSAFCVTGLVVVDTQTHWSFFGQAVILILIQAGGLGFMVGASLDEDEDDGLPEEAPVGLGIDDDQAGDTEGRDGREERIDEVG